ncbi:glycosyltransferase family 2 protein [Paenibacillus sp. FSL R7-0337]|uniref:glycosyltransferase family 2 protein n=1 Tax=Paenibacillus sp. FSL R7-0337 TaxID=1926588 RepID=UPI0009701BB7|nr:glycosyltransferase family 2 protein [Paenibacillus sp. FSL R7-0337]OMF98467.1 hypothetical protein BK147_09525 [Paenibacillus sp. FSL R7-0337]
MDLSVIIPTYNMKTFLYHTLDYLSKQIVESNHNYEIIIVDDGSTDETGELIGGFSNLIPVLKYYRRERDDKSCRARARNIGIKQSAGDIITFLDSGIVIPPNFISTVIKKYKMTTSEIVLHYILGKRIDSTKDDISMLKGLSPDTLEAISGKLRTNIKWMDHRNEMFCLMNDDINKYQAPWVLSDSACLTLSKQLVARVNGFDDSYITWGVEDVDFLYRAHKAGGNLRVEREAFAFHLPHPSEESEIKVSSNQSNKLKFHQKFYDLETEMYTLYPNSYLNYVLSRFNNLNLYYVLPQISDEMIQVINHLVETPGSKHSLIVGVDNLIHAMNIRTTHIFSHNQAVFKMLKRNLDKTVEYILGCKTNYSKNFFNTTVVTDFLRLFPNRMLKEMVLELSRISQELVLIYTPNFISLVETLDEYPWADLDGIVGILDSSDLKYEISKFGNTMLIKVTK